MKIPRTRIASAVAATTLTKGASKEYAREIAAYLLAEGRVGELDSLLRDVQNAWAKKGYVEVIARSAHPLDETTKKDIAAQVKQLYPAAQTLVVTPLIDESVIGGVQISVADQQLDLSIEAKLNKFKQLTGSKQ